MKNVLIIVMLLFIVCGTFALRAGDGVNMEVEGAQACTDAQNTAKTSSAKACKLFPWR